MYCPTKEQYRKSIVDANSDLLLLQYTRGLRQSAINILLQPHDNSKVIPNSECIMRTKLTPYLRRNEFVHYFSGIERKIVKNGNSWLRRNSTLLKYYIQIRIYKTKLCKTVQIVMTHSKFIILNTGSFQAAIVLCFHTAKCRHVSIVEFARIL